MTRRLYGSRLLGDDFAVFPDVDRRAVHARGLARNLSSAAQGATDGESQRRWYDFFGL